MCNQGLVIETQTEKAITLPLNNIRYKENKKLFPIFFVVVASFPLIIYCPLQVLLMILLLVVFFFQNMPSYKCIYLFIYNFFSFVTIVLYVVKLLLLYCIKYTKKQRRIQQNTHGYNYTINAYSKFYFSQIEFLNDAGTKLIRRRRKARRRDESYNKTQIQVTVTRTATNEKF